MKKRPIAIFLTTLMGMSVLSANFVSAAENSDSASLPAKIDLRDYNGMNYVTPVKNQGELGCCWAFGIAAASESSYLYANNLGVSAGEANNNADFSEKYINWYLYHGITEADVTKGKIRASQVGEGYDVSEADKAYINMVYNFGGSGTLGANFLASGFGPVDERVTVNGDTPYFYSGKNKIRSKQGSWYSPDDDWSLPVNAEYRNAPSIQGFKSFNYLPCPASFDSDGNYSFDREALDILKSEISKGHSISIGVCFGSNMNSTNWAMFNPKNTLSNHEVTIVGYDDNYSKSNFTRYHSNGKEVKRTTPPADGAFIVKNSNGALTEEDKATAVTDANGKTVYENPNAGKFGIDESGYFYLSYYDQTIATPVSVDFEKADSDNYSKQNYDQYDLAMSGIYTGSDFDAETAMANVFDAEEDEYLYKISYGTENPDTTVSYKIYKNPVDNNPSSGTLLEEGVNSHELSGYHNVKLNGEYFLKEGEKYSVILTMQYTPAGGSSSVYRDIMPVTVNISPDGQHTTINNSVVNAGESFLYSDGKWTDISGIRENLVDRAYPELMKLTGPVKAFLGMNPDGKDGLSIDNYPIKALLVPASEHGAETEVILGDVDGNGKIEIADATLAQKRIAEIVFFTSDQELAADTDADGKITISDVTCIQKHLAEMPAPEGIGKPIAK